MDVLVINIHNQSIDSIYLEDSIMILKIISNFKLMSLI